MPQKNESLSLEMKYKYYEKSVQNHLSDIDFINDEYKNIKGKKALLLREDFCGTAALACDWTKQSREHFAWGIDLDPEPIDYGKKNHYQRLNEEEKKRMTYIEGNVLDSYSFKPEIVVAFNFSYFIFKKRNELLKYFKEVKNSLSKDGVFFVDIFGGTNCLEELEEETEFDKHSYFWDCDSYNPLTNECQYYIHFQGKDGIKHEKVFSYDWRMWTVREIKDLMEDAGFKDVYTYWEGDDGDGEGDGEFYRSTEEENCESWVTYVVGVV